MIADLPIALAYSLNCCIMLQATIVVVAVVAAAGEATIITTRVTTLAATTKAKAKARTGGISKSCLSLIPPLLYLFLLWSVRYIYIRLSIAQWTDPIRP